MRRYFIVFALLLLTVGIIIFFRLAQERENATGKRVREDQIIAYRDSAVVEFFYSQPYDAETVIIQVEVFAGDGGCPITGLITVEPGETVTFGETVNGKSFSAFASGIFEGRILVYDKNMKLINRVEPLECRIYESINSPYDSVKHNELMSIPLEPAESEPHPQHHVLRISQSKYEIYTDIHSLSTQNRNLNIEIYAIIDNQEHLIAKAYDVEPKSVCSLFYANRDVVDMLKADLKKSAVIRYYYSDSGELYIEETAEFEMLE